MTSDATGTVQRFAKCRRRSSEDFLGRVHCVEEKCTPPSWSGILHNVTSSLPHAIDLKAYVAVARNTQIHEVTRGLLCGVNKKE